MFTILLVLLIIVAILMIGIILLQNGMTSSFIEMHILAGYPS